MKLIEKFNYTELERKKIDGKRRYVTPDGKKLPSVTTILESTKPERDRRALANWRKRVGKEEASRISQEASNVGGLMHKDLERQIKGEGRIEGDNIVHRIGKRMSSKVLENIEEDIDEVWGSEVRLFYPELYAGTTDLVGLWRGRPTIMDFKQANKPKKKEWVTDYFLQGVAYALAHNSIYDTDIKSVAIFICVRNQDYDFQSFEIVDDEFDMYSLMWAKRLSEFYNVKLN